MKIHVHVGKIVLHGLPVSPNGAPAIGIAVEAELGRLLRAHGLAAELQRGGRISGVPKASFQFSAAHSPAALGTNIAQSVFGTLGESFRSKIACGLESRRGSSGTGIAAVGSAR